MSMRRVTPPGIGAKKIKASFFRRMANMAMRNDVMTLGTGIAAIFNDSFVARTVVNSNTSDIIVVKLTKDIFPRFSSELDETSASSASSGSSTAAADDNCTRQEWNESDRVWEDSSEDLQVYDAYNLCYDKDSYQICVLHAESDKYFIVPQMTVRLAQTVADIDGTYPEEIESDGESDGEQILTYAIRFVNSTYPNQAGGTERVIEQKEGTQDDPPHAYTINLIDFYIEEGSLIFVFWQNGQWYTAYACGFTGKQKVVVEVECVSDGLQVDWVTNIYRSGHLMRIEDEEGESEDVSSQSEASGVHGQGGASEGAYG